MTLKSVTVKVIGALLLAAVCGLAEADDQALLSRAQALLENGQAQEAYSLLQSYEETMIGNAQYDRAFAEAAAGVGAYNEASLALERVLQLDAGALSARMELARIYRSMDNDEQAKYQLEKISSSTSSTSVLQESRNELQLVEEKLSKRRKRPAFDPQIAKRPATAPEVVAAIPVGPSIPPQVAVDLGPVMAKARQLLNDGQPLAAYDTLAQLEFEGSGNVEFDYLLGVAALDAGKPDRATLALERVLAVDPNFAGARIDMGRAYTMLGNTIQAKEEFNTVLKLNPPDNARQKVERFIAEIEQRNQPEKARWSGFFAFTLGRDSNVNSATRDSEQFIAGFNASVILDRDSTETASNYLGVAGKIQFNYRLNEKVSFYAGLDSELQRNFQASQFDRSAAAVRLGAISTFAKHELEFSVVAGKSFLEQHAYRDLAGLAVQWRYNLNDQNQLQAVVQHNRLRYPEAETRVFDTDQNILGLNWLRSFGENNRGIGFIGTFIGAESDIHGNESGAKRFYGIRGGGQYGLTANAALYGTLGVTFADYDRLSIVHLKTRADRRYDMVLGLNYQLWSNWSLRPQLSLTHQDSNIGLYDFDRNEIFVTLRRDWR